MRHHHLLRLFFIYVLLFCQPAQAQQDTDAIKAFLHHEADVLAGPGMYGRGYVNNGHGLAAKYIEDRFREYGLKPVNGQHSYSQSYSFPVNVFDGRMELQINGKELQPGADYIVDARSGSYSAHKLPVEVIDLKGIKSEAALKEVFRHLTTTKARVLENADTPCKALHMREEELITMLPKGCYLLPQKAKLTWTVEGTQRDALVFYVKQDALPERIEEASVDVKATLVPHEENENIIAEVPGEVKDTFIAFTAHYDHLGMMGGKAIFPGASDNASGMAMLLYLASYFAVHPAHYSVLFIAFSGEETGLLGSQYYVQHPTVPLANVRFLTNIDIMGDASDGVTVVNATEFPRQFGLLQEVNKKENYLPVIKSRGKAHNSDHYFFTEEGVPSFFIYSNGGKGYYHDIYDKPEELTLNHVAGVAQLLIAATSGL